MVSMDICSGLYAYHTVDKQWICLAPDQSGDVSVKPVFPRSGHVTVFHPVREGQWLVCSFVIYFLQAMHQLFVIGGQRQQEVLR